MDRLFEILLGNTVVALAIALAALAALLLRRPALSHVLWLLVLAKLLTPPIVRVPLALPASPVTATSAAPQAETPSAPSMPPRVTTEVALSDTRADAPPTMAADNDRRAMGEAEEAGGQPDAWARPQAAPSASIAGSAFQGIRTHRTALLLAAWLAGTGWYAATFVRRTRRFAAIVRSAEPAGPAVTAHVREVADRIGLTVVPDVRLVTQASSPMLVGMGDGPLLLLPAALVERLDADSLRAVVAHELAHLRRRDHWVRWLEAAATAALWWHPLLWLARRGLHEAEEQCCDAWVVWALPGARRAYAEALVTTAGLLSETPTAAALPPGASGLGQFQQLRRRLVMIMHRSTRRRMSAAAKVVAGAAVLLTLPFLPAVAERRVDAAEKAVPADRSAAGSGVAPRALAAAPAAPAGQPAAPAAAAAEATGSLQDLIDKASPGSEVKIPKGVWKEPIRITKPLKLRGDDRGECVIEVTSDQPAVRLAHKGEAVLENVTVRWQLETSNRSPEPQAAVVAKDGAVRLRNVRVVAAGDHARCPSGFTVQGFANVKIEACEFEGFDFTIQVGGGAKCTITDSVVANPGHCGITAGPEGTINVSQTIVTGSGFHGLRCTGGELNAEHSLVIANKNRGFYLGNKSARGTIRQNVIQDNGTGVSGFAESNVRIQNNYIAGCDFAGVDMRDTCRLTVDRNLFANNGRALVLFKESGKNRNTIGRNASAGNKTESEGFESAPALEKLDGPIPDGEFATAKAGGFGVKDAAKLKPVWERWTALRKGAAAAGTAE